MARYIDANVLIKNIVKIKDLRTLSTKTIGEAISNTPTADVVEVKHGKWIWLEGNLYECSECPAKTEVDEAMNEPLYQFCPYCGAKMDGGKTEW